MKRLATCALLTLGTAPLIAQTASGLDPHVALRHSLADLAVFEWRTYAHSLAFVGDLANVARAQFRPDAGVRVWMLTANDSGWSAVAISDATPDDACGIYYGRAPAPLGRGGPGTLVCLQAPPERLANLHPVLLAHELADSELPRILHCDYESRADTVPTAVIVDIRGIVDGDGTLRAQPLVVRDSPSLLSVAAALRQVSRCRFVPGRHDGVAAPVSVVVHWRMFGNGH